MNKLLWIIYEKNTDDDIQELIRTVQEAGMDFHHIKYVPFGGMDWSFVPTDRPVILCGSIWMVRNALKKGKFYPCAWFDKEILSCRSYYSHWGKYLLQKEYAFYTLKEIARLKDYLFDKFGKDDKLFIRPDGNDKEFCGDIVCKEKFIYWYDSANWHNPPKDLLCVVAKPEEIIAEYRFIVADNKVVAGSQYMRNGVEYDPNYPTAAGELAEEASKVWSPHPIYSLDVAETPEGFKIVECGSFNCSGYYSANLKDIVRAASEIAIREWEDIFGEGKTDLEA